jgi:hypothetical protein
LASAFADQSVRPAITSTARAGSARAMTASADASVAGFASAPLANANAPARSPAAASIVATCHGLNAASGWRSRNVWNTVARFASGSIQSGVSASVGFPPAESAASRTRSTSSSRPSRA